MNNQILVSQIEEVPSELGEPDCKLIEPFLLNEKDETLSPWLVKVCSQNIFMIHSDKILTISDPKPTLLEKYQNLLK
jgi:hypothetical protein